ncbi:hypothetical protein D3C77_684900 [compost metagenome]
MENSTPMVARKPIDHLWFLRSSRLTCRAPANSSDGRNQVISTCEKSISRIISCISSSSSGYPSRARPCKARDSSRAVSMTPMAGGRPMKR